MIRAFAPLLLAGVFFVTAGCNLSGILGVTFETISDDYFTSVWSVKVKESSSDDWVLVTLTDETGTVMHTVRINDVAYFNLPGEGTYQVAAYDISGNEFACASGSDITPKAAADFDCAIWVGQDGTVSIN